MLQGIIDAAEGKNAWKHLGKIRLGINVGTKDKPLPKDVDYFVCDLEENPELDVLGENPKEINILLLGSTLDQVFRTEAAIYGKNGARKCWTNDDRIAHRYLDLNWDFEKDRSKEGAKEPKFAWVDMACPNKECEYRRPLENGKANSCQQRGYLHFSIPQTVGQTGKGGNPVTIGEYMLKIGSTVSLTQIFTTLRGVQNLCADRPQGISGIRMKLVRKQVKFFKDFKNDGQQAGIVKYVPVLELDWLRLMQGDQALLGPLFERPVPLIPTFDPAQASEHEDETPPGASEFATGEENMGA